MPVINGRIVLIARPAIVGVEIGKWSGGSLAKTSFYYNATLNVPYVLPVPFICTIKFNFILSGYPFPDALIEICSATTGQSQDGIEWVSSQIQPRQQSGNPGKTMNSKKHWKIKLSDNWRCCSGWLLKHYSTQVQHRHERVIFFNKQRVHILLIVYSHECAKSSCSHILSAACPDECENVSRKFVPQ